MLLNFNFNKSNCQSKIFCNKNKSALYSIYSDPDKYGHSGCGIGFDARFIFLFLNVKLGKSNVFFWYDGQ